MRKSAFNLTVLSLVAIFGSVACVQEEEGASSSELTSEALVESMYELTAVACNPREAASCDRGEGCLGIGEDRTGAPLLHVCAAGRCSSDRECGAGYVCRVDHCIAVERDALSREDASREDASREEASREDANREEASREEASREDANREEASREDASREDANREEANREDASREVLDLFVASDVVVEPTRQRGVFNVMVGVGALNQSAFENLWYEILLVNGREILGAARRPAPTGREAVTSRVLFENVRLGDGTYISVDHSNHVDEVDEGNNTVRVPVR